MIDASFFIESANQSEPEMLKKENFIPSFGNSYL
jgi:hypothetical protein